MTQWPLQVKGVMAEVLSPWAKSIRLVSPKLQGRLDPGPKAQPGSLSGALTKVAFQKLSFAQMLAATQQIHSMKKAQHIALL